MQGTSDSDSTSTAGHGGKSEQGVAGAKTHSGVAGAAANQAAPVTPAGNQAVTARSGQLPFTGLPVIALLAVGASLLAAGAMLRIAKASERDNL